MNKPIEPLPLLDVQGIVGQHIEHVRDNARLLHIWLSVAEYLKDAARWHYVRNNEFLDGLAQAGPDGFQKWVDEQLRKKP